MPQQHPADVALHYHKPPLGDEEQQLGTFHLVRRKKHSLMLIRRRASGPTQRAAGTCRSHLLREWHHGVLSISPLCGGDSLTSSRILFLARVMAAFRTLIQDSFSSGLTARNTRLGTCSNATQQVRVGSDPVEQQTQPEQSQHVARLAKSFSLHLLTFMVYYLEH